MKLQFYLIYFSLSTLTLDLWHVLLSLLSFCVYSLQMKKNFHKILQKQKITTISDEERFPKDFLFFFAAWHFHLVIIFLSLLPIQKSISSYFAYLLQLTPSTMKKGCMCIYLFVVVFIKHSKCTWTCTRGDFKPWVNWIFVSHS